MEDNCWLVLLVSNSEFVNSLVLICTTFQPTSIVKFMCFVSNLQPLVCDNHWEVDIIYFTDLDILVIDDDADAAMTEDMWADYEKFESERQRNMY